MIISSHTTADQAKQAAVATRKTHIGVIHFFNPKSGKFEVRAKRTKDGK
jgi:hypothetical protein